MKNKKRKLTFSVQFDKEKDGRWIAEISSIPGALAYGNTKYAALRKVQAIALRTMADRTEEGHSSLLISKLFSYELAHR